MSKIRKVYTISLEEGKYSVLGDTRDHEAIQFLAINLKNLSAWHYKMEYIVISKYDIFIAKGVIETMELNSVLKAFQSKKIPKNEIIEFDKYTVKLREKDGLLSIRTKEKNIDTYFNYLDALTLSDQLSKLVSQFKIIQ